MNSWTCHASSVTDIRIDSTGKWFASVSLDGKLAMGLLSTSHTLPQIYEFHRPIKCVQFDPEFSKTKRLVIGGHAGEVVCIDLKQPNLPKKITWVKNLGYIVALHWALPNILLYATEESAVEVYDIKNQIVLHRCIIPTMTVEVHAYRCFFFWKDPETLALAWNQTFQIILFKVMW
ncbi:Vacuolar protein sorting-associated protein 41 [Coelomomyces lativittatus]|nr:Vacuolar protein sorting-associated protein 41 [Coelomomyces lativittatus]